MDRDVDLLAVGPGLGLVPRRPLGDVGLDVGRVARAIACVNVAERLRVGQLVDGGEVGRPVAVAPVWDVVRITVDIAVPAILARGVRSV